MLAAVYRGAGAVQLEELPIPVPSPGDLLVRVSACGVCGTDLKKIVHGLVEPPRVFGHEIAGTIEAVGPGEVEWQCGQRVVVQHHVPCGSCFYCRRRLYSHCPGYRRTGTTAGFEPAGGGFAEYVLVHPFARPGVVAIPDGVDAAVASFLEPVNTVLKAVLTLRPEPGDTVLVLGLGSIGLLFCQELARHGCRVLGADPFPSRRTLADRLGCATLDPGAAAVIAACREATGGRGADCAVITAPGNEPVTTALRAVRPAGSVLLFAHTRPGEELVLDGAEIGVHEKRLLGSYSADIDLQPLAAQLVFSGTLRVEPLITHRIPLARIQEALDIAANPRGGSVKVVVQP